MKVCINQFINNNTLYFDLSSKNKKFYEILKTIKDSSVGALEHEFLENSYIIKGIYTCSFLYDCTYKCLNGIPYKLVINNNGMTIYVDGLKEELDCINNFLFSLI